MEKSYSIREDFLRDFMKRVIVEYSKNFTVEAETKSPMAGEIEERMSALLGFPLEGMQPSKKIEELAVPYPASKPTKVPVQPPRNILTPQRKQILPVPLPPRGSFVPPTNPQSGTQTVGGQLNPRVIQSLPPQRPQANIQMPRPMAPKPIDPQELTAEGLGKLAPFLMDPSVSSVESPGPSKPVLLNRSGRIQPTNIAFTAEETEDLLKKISNKAKIPLESGVFKALVGELIVTAVISDFVGTRFVVQKRTPSF